MDEEQVKALVVQLLGEGLAPITASLKGLDTLRAQVKTQGDTLTQALEAITAPPAAKTTEDTTKPPTAPDPLIGTVAKLQAQLDSMQAEKSKAEYSSQLESMLDGFDHKSRNVSRTLIAAMFPEASKTEAGYVLQDGTLLKDAVSSYFGSDDGKVLLKGKRTVQGTAVEEGERVAPVVAPGGLDLSSLSF
jgi:hypothetical protein